MLKADGSGTIGGCRRTPRNIQQWLEHTGHIQGTFGLDRTVAIGLTGKGDIIESKSQWFSPQSSKCRKDSTSDTFWILDISYVFFLNGIFKVQKFSKKSNRNRNPKTSKKQGVPTVAVLSKGRPHFSRMLKLSMVPDEPPLKVLLVYTVCRAKLKPIREP